MSLAQTYTGSFCSSIVYECMYLFVNACMNVFKCVYVCMYVCIIVWMYVDRHSMNQCMYYCDYQTHLSKWFQVYDVTAEFSQMQQWETIPKGTAKYRGRETMDLSCFLIELRYQYILMSCKAQRSST